MTDVDLGKVKRNVASMVQQHAPEADIDKYITDAGTTIDAVKSYQAEDFPSILARRAKEAWESRPAAPTVPKNTNEFLQQTKQAIPGAMKAMGAGFGVVASPLGAAGERLEYLGAKAAGLPEEKAQKVAKDTGDVSEALLGIVPGIKGAPAAMESAASKALGAGREAVNAVSDRMGTTPRTAAQIKVDSQAAYDTAEKLGGTLTPKFTDKFLAEVDKIAPQTEEGKIFAGNNQITALIKRAQKLRGEGGYSDPYGMRSTAPSKSLSLKGLEEIDKELTNQVAQNFGPTGLTEQGKKIMELQDKLRDMVANASGDDIGGGKQGFDALKSATAKWSQHSRMRDIEQIISRAQMMDNPATALKTGFRTLYNNTKRISGYTVEEKAAIKLAAEGKYTDILRTFGSRLIPIAKAVHGGGIGGDLGAYAASSASRKSAELLQMKRSNDVLRAIGARKTPPTATADQALGAETDPLAIGGKR